MQPPADLLPLAVPASIGAAMLSAIVFGRVHRLLTTGLTFWLLIMALSFSAYALVTGLFPGDLGSAVADVSIITAGCAAYAASRWLRRTFEVGAKHDY